MRTERNHPLVAAIGAIARAAGVLLGVFSLFGLLFIGQLTFGMVAGGFAFAAALTPAGPRGDGGRRPPILMALAVTGLLFQLLDVVHYHWSLAIPGNYYSWPGAAVYSGTLAALAAYGAYFRFRSGQDTA